VGGVLAWLALVAPDDLSTLSVQSLVRLPLEGVVAVAVLLALSLVGLPSRVRAAVAAGIGVLLALLLTLKVLDTGLLQALGRPLRPTQDWTYAGSGLGFLTDSVGRPLAVLVVVLGAVGWTLGVVLLGWSVVRLQGLVDRRRRGALLGLGAAAVVWTALAATGLELPDGRAVASTDAAGLVARHVLQVRSDLQDRTTFAREIAVDPFRAAPASHLLQGLRGKDVVVVFVESYGRVAVEGSPISAGVDATLRTATSRLQASGVGSRSAFLTSPTFGGISWLAHSTLQSGLWVDSQERYDTLLTTHRLTLSGAFRRAGWRTVDAVPSDQDDWPQGEAFYGFDHLYGAGNLGYAGPRFGYSTMPDQYVLAALQRLELTPGPRRPVMAELDLTSSHSPWAPLPSLVPWASVGDGSVFDPMPALGDTAAHVWADQQRIAAAYGQSVEYSVGAVTSFLQTTTDPNLVVLMLGDHQPSDAVSGAHAGRDVPVTVLAKDPRVLSRVAGWGWQPGLLPTAGAPVWRMDAFRDQFLSAFSR
jgi:hypothetical protein